MQEEITTIKFYHSETPTMGKSLPPQLDKKLFLQGDILPQLQKTAETAPDGECEKHPVLQFHFVKKFAPK